MFFSITTKIENNATIVQFKAFAEMRPHRVNQSSAINITSELDHKNQVLSIKVSSSEPVELPILSIRVDYNLEPSVFTVMT